LPAFIPGPQVWDQHPGAWRAAQAQAGLALHSVFQAEGGRAVIIPYSAYARQGPELLGLGDSVIIKVCAVKGFDNDWAAYKGFSYWTDEEVLASGDKLSEEAAVALFPGFAQAGLMYRP